MKKTMFFIFILTQFACNLQAQFEKVTLHITDGLANNANLQAHIETNMSKLLTRMNETALEGNSLDLSGIDMSDDAISILQTFWSISPMTCPVSLMERKCLRRELGDYQLRDIHITWMEEEENLPDVSKKQKMVFNFNKNGRIDYIYMANDLHDIGNVLLNGNWNVKELARRERILDFVEQFRTAYNLKDTTMIKQVFSDSALIITGRVIRSKVVSNEIIKNIPQKIIDYQIQTKAQYLERLKRIFYWNKYINVTFSEYEIVRHPNPNYSDIYGVSFKQNWNASNYKDTGYVFLLIDFRDDLNPLIHVRTWQPDTINGEPLSDRERFKVTSFNF